MGDIKLKTGERKTTVSREAVREAVREVMNVQTDSFVKPIKSVKAGSKAKKK